MNIASDYNAALVAISIGIAIASAYTSLEHVERLRASTVWLHQKLWMITASVCMGGGIWAMHFIGMMAVKAETDVRFDVGMTALSFVVPIGVVGFAYHFLRQRVSPAKIALCGLVMGQGIFMMHYLGMAALRMNAAMNHDKWAVAASLAIAIVVSIIALIVAFGKQPRTVPNKIFGAILLGVAVSGMHYTAMAGTTLSRYSLSTSELLNSYGVADKTQMALAITIVAIAILFSTTIAGMSADAATRKSNNAHMEMLINELNHRVKNTLATVQGLARHSLKGVPPEMLLTFEKRLISLANSHSLLADTHWTDVSLYDLMNSELEPYIVETGPSYSIEGVDIKISPRTAVSLELAIHEMVTNAVKYGCLSVETGHLEIDWGYMTKTRIFINWRETLGPATVAPTTRSFGSKLIATTVEQLNGNLMKDFIPEGLSCRLEIDINI